ncbi:hypothetical protein [Gemmata sp.]|uniref:hypothetical protein n=1 Tax=Gemmata sp. TaxID=1914242 RepID=UPI003F71DFC9
MHRAGPVAPLKLASKDPPPPPAHVDADAVHAADNWPALVGLLRGGASVHLSEVRDAENGDPMVSGTAIAAVHPPGGSQGRTVRKTATGKTLEVVVLELTGGCRVEKCRGRCGEVKPLDLYSRRVDSPDGRNHYCLACERNRVKAYERRKAERAGAAGVEEPAPAPCVPSTSPVSSAPAA